MARIERSALVSYTAQQMFDLVNDIETYPQYMPGCVGAEVLDRGDDWLTARLDISRAGFQQSFATRNELTPPNTMTMELAEGPFKYMRGAWQFDVLSDEACKVTFWLEFEFANMLIGLAAGKLFQQVATEQVDALCKRAKLVYA